MSTKFQIKRSSVQGKAPTTSNIDTGELAINVRDNKLFSSNGSVVFEVGSNLNSLHVGAGGISISNGGVFSENGNRLASNNYVQQYLQVANTAAIVANNTTKYLQVANATPSVDTTLTGNTSIQRLDIANAAGTQINSTALRNGVYFGNNYFISSYDFEIIDSTGSRVTIAQSQYPEVALEFLVLVTDTSTTPKERQFSKILAIHDGNNAFISEYGRMYTGSGPLATFTATFQRTPDWIYLEANPTTSNRLKYKVARMGIRD